MNRLLLTSILLSILLPTSVWATSLHPNAKRSTVFIANYSDDGQFAGWGSGFFVDEGIVVTNKHVIEKGDWYRVFATSAEDAVDLECVKTITKSDVKVNLDDDVAYMRVYLPCEHGMMSFSAKDPVLDEKIWAIGYPYKASAAVNFAMTTSTGSVTATAQDQWFETDAFLDRGSSGGPVVNQDGSAVLGVAVAKSVDAKGNYVRGLFIPASVILEGLLSANDPRFGYTPQIASSSQSSNQEESISSTSSRRASSTSSRASFVFPDVTPIRIGYDAIMSLYERGVIGGYRDGTFKPDNGINRAEFIKVLVAGFRPEEVKGETNCFSDITFDWYAPYVCAAKRLGWISGYDDGTFRPSQQVNRAEGMKIVVSAFGGDAKARQDMPSDARLEMWYYPYVAVGVSLGIIDPEKRFHADRILTREIAAMWIDGAE